MASITSVISLFVLLLATCCYSAPFNPVNDGTTQGTELAAGQTMKNHEKNGIMHPVADKDSANVPDMHGPRASAERDSGEVTSTEQSATDKNVLQGQDSSSTMTSNSKSSSTQEAKDKRYYFIQNPSLVRLYDGRITTGTKLADGDILVHGPIVTHVPEYYDGSLVRYFKYSTREAKDEGSSKGSSTSESSNEEQSTKQGESPKQKRGFAIHERKLVTPVLVNGELMEVSEPLIERLVYIPSIVKREDQPTGSQTSEPSPNGEATKDKSTDKREFIGNQEVSVQIDRTYIPQRTYLVQDSYLVQPTLQRAVFLDKRAENDEGQSTGSQTSEPSQNGKESKDESKDKRFILVKELQEPSVQFVPTYYRPSTSVQVTHERFHTQPLVNEILLETRGDKGQDQSKDESKGTDPLMTGTAGHPDKRAVYFEDEAHTRLIDGSIVRGPVLNNGYVSLYNPMLTHGRIFLDRPMYTSRYLDNSLVSYVTYVSRDVKDSTKDKNIPSQANSGESGENTATTSQTHVDSEFENSSVSPFDNKKVKDGSSEESNAPLSGKEHQQKENMPIKSDKIKEQTDSNQPINKEEKSGN